MISWGDIFGRRRHAGEPPDVAAPVSDHAPPAVDAASLNHAPPDCDHAPPAVDAASGHVVTGPGSEEVRRLLAMSHDKLGTISMGNDAVPVIIFDGAEFENLEGWNRGAAGKQGITTIMTDLDILRDFKGNVFVEVKLSFEDDKTLKVMISANRHLSFFKALAASGMLALATEGCERLITIQLPQPHKARDALDIIEAGLTPGADKNA